MRKLILCLTVLLCTNIKGQDYLGFVNSNYAGITGAQLNPASIADSRLRFDINLIGLNFNTANNYIGVKRSAFAHEGSLFDALKKSLNGDPNAFPAFNDNNFQLNYLINNQNGKDKSVFLSSRVSLPSFMLSLGTKNAIGFSINARAYANIDGVSEELARLLYSDIGRTKDFNVNDLTGINIKNKNLSINSMAWLEYGLTYAHVFRDKDQHFIKAGITPKLLQGLVAAYANIKDMEFRFDNDAIAIGNDSLQYLSLLKTDVNYGHSKNLEFPGENAPDRNKNPFVGGDPTLFTTFEGVPKFESFPGLGLDLGFVYEWRPDFQKYKYDMDGKKDLWRKDQNKYKLKVGVSVVDIGGIKYAKGKESNNFSVNIDSIQYRLLKTKDYPVYDMDRIIDSLTQKREVKPDFIVALPTALSIQLDYNIWRNFYINLTPFIAFQHKNREAKIHDVTNISLTPRWDHKWFGVSLPLSYNSFYARTGQAYKLGTMLRLGPLSFGTNDLINYFSGDVYGANFYFLVKVPVPYGKIRDRDKDGISDKKDKCKDIPGVWEFMGCPDTDGDHVQDSEDKCPDIPGLIALQGCPDRDGDGITDAEDMCPDSAGTAEFKGCPDRDNDKIIDREDECPDVPGLPEFKGCPDTDGDGTPDKEDLCPDVFGPIEFKGCPDKDGDTVLDKDDDCPEVAGPVENKGCPWPDTDGDGIIDREDSCVTIPGIAKYKGCPPPPPPAPIKAAEKKIIEKAFASLEFATAKDVIKPKSLPSLNELAKLLKQHDVDWTLKLSGHTDNEGSPESNMALSEKRSNAVKNYLVKKGVREGQITTEWFGETMPIDDNATAKGRQKNRRVEMTIIFRE
jgi:outer membrane protein OmpA-like peptidoglycan-associated protein